MIVEALFPITFTNKVGLFLATVTLSLLLVVLRDYIKRCRVALMLPGPPALPLIGNCLLPTEKDMLTNRMLKAYDQYGGVVRLWLTVFPMFGVLEPQDLQTILSSKSHTDKMYFYRILYNFLGRGLITSSGLKWSTHRKYLQPAFKSHILEKFIDTFVDSSSCLLQRLKAAPQVINVAPFINDCVLDILNEAVLGIPVMLTKKSGEIESPFRQGKVMLTERVSKPWLLFGFFYSITETAMNEMSQKQKLDTFTRSIITMKRDRKANGEPLDRKSLIDYMIEISEDHKDFTDEDIIDEASTFMLAGQDSVGAGIAFALHLLAQNPDDQAKCIDELDEIFGDDKARPPNMNDLRAMKYLEMCIKETLRLYPSVPTFGRTISETIKVGQHYLPAGSEVFITPWITHRLAHLYPEPERFIPERFSPENCEKRHPYAYIPFSAGPRNCVGHKFAIIEMKVVISQILRHYRLLPVPGKTKVMPVYRVTVRASGGLWVKLQKR